MAQLFEIRHYEGRQLVGLTALVRQCALDCDCSKRYLRCRSVS